ncbi:MAG TPA: hypothetical protein VGM88_07020 [Kofleriaceae bacterium]
MQILGKVDDPKTHTALEGVAVTITAPSGQSFHLITDGNGLYHQSLSEPGEYHVVFVLGTTTAEKHVAIQENNFLKLDAGLDLPGEEIHVTGTAPFLPAAPVMPKPHTDPRKTPPYSDRLALSDDWKRQWVLLEVDERGHVARFKWLNHVPTPDLAPIAEKYALALTFTPGEDGHGHAVRTQVVWPMEWPSWGWLVMMTGVATGVPRHSLPGPVGNPELRGYTRAGMAYSGDLLERVPCYTGFEGGGRNLDSAHAAQRDCSKPDLSTAAKFDWIYPAAH